MPESDPFAAIKTPWDSATPPSGGAIGATRAPPIPVPDHTLLRRIGQGAYGEVWLARNALGQFRAVKIVHRRAFDSDRPFEREFAGIQRFEPVSRRHESQLNILHVGRGPDYFYYVMELADDQASAVVEATAPTSESSSTATLNPDTYSPRTLRSELLFRGRLPVDECIRLGLALTTALEHLHRHSLVHRDIKPSNIVFVNGIPKLADIGLVAQAERTMSFVGTEGYLPPEGPGTVQADLFSLGRVLYEISTGHDRQQFPELPTNVHELPDRAALAEFNEVLVRACASDIKQRYQTAAEMHADLALLQSGKSVARARWVERRLKFVARAGAAVTALAAVIAVGWLWQARQTREVRELAAQKTTLLEANQRQAQAQEQQIIRALSASGVQRLEADDPAAALPWFVEALRRVEAHSPEQTSLHRLRLGNLLRYQPRLLSVTPVAGAVRTLAFSPDGRWLAAGSDAWMAQIIEVQSGTVVRTLAHSNGVKSVEFSRDSRRLLTGCRDGLARVWDLNATNAPLVLPHQASVRFATFSPDGQIILTASADKTARLWRASDAKPIGPPLLHSQPLYHACFSPDGQRIATGTGEIRKSGELHLWSLASGTEIAPPTVLKDLAFWTAFSPDGTRLASACGEPAFDLLLSRPGVFVDGRTGAFIRDLDHVDRIFHVDFSPDGKHLAIATMGNELLIADGSTGGRALAPLKHSRWVQWAAFSPDSRWVASASSDGTARVWDASTGVPVTAPLRHPGEVYCVAFDPTGRLLATAGDGGLVFLWDIGHGEPDLGSMWYSQGETGAALTPDGRRVLTAAPRRPVARTAAYYPDRGDEPVRIYEMETGRLLWSFPIPGGTPFVPTVIAPDSGTLALGSYNGRIRSRDLRDGRLRWETEALPGLCEPRAFSHDGRLLAITTQDTADPFDPKAQRREVRLLSAEDGQPVGPPLVHPRPATGIAFGPGDRVVVTASHDGRLRLWNVATGRLLRTLKVVDGELDEVRFSRDGRRLLVPGKYDKSAQLLDAETGNAVIPPLRHTGIVWDAMFDAEERRILTASSDLSAAQWDARTGERIDPPLLHHRGVNAVCYDGTGQLIATAGADRTVRLWNAENGELLAIPFQYGAPAQSVELNKTGDRLVTSSADGRVQIWRLSPTDWTLEDLRRYAEAVSGQALSADGRLRTLSADEIAARMSELRVRRSQDFVLSSGQLERWHQREKTEAEGTGNEFAARFHAARFTPSVSNLPSASPSAVVTNRSASAFGSPPPGAFQPLCAASLTNSGEIGIHFGRNLETQSSATAVTNYQVLGATVTGAMLSPDRQGVLLKVSGLTGTTFTVNIGSVRDLSGNATSAATTLTGPVLPQSRQDVGTSGDPAVPGVAFSSRAGEFDVLAGGSDIWDSSDHFHFVLEQKTGNFDVKVRVESLDPINRWSKAGIMVRESLAPGCRQLLAAVNPAGPTIDGRSGGRGNNEYLAEFRAGTGSLSGSWATNTAVSDVSYPNAWIRLRREGDTFSAYRSGDGRTWIQLGSILQAYPSTVYLGLATLSRNNAPGFSTLARYRDYGPTEKSRPQ